jgi:hypothetical protein
MAARSFESERPVWSLACWSGRHERCRDNRDSCECLCHVTVRPPETAA